MMKTKYEMNAVILRFTPLVDLYYAAVNSKIEAANLSMIQVVLAIS